MNKKQVKLIVAIVTAFLLVVILYFALRKSPNVIFEVAPSEATVYVDGKEVRGTSVYASPGKHSIKATMEGFGSNTQTILVPETGSITALVLLDPNSQAGVDYLKKNPEEQLKRESVGGKIFNRTDLLTADKNPLFGELPFTDRLYRIDYGPSPTKPANQNAIAYFVTYVNEQGRREAEEYFTFKGVDLQKTEIIYTSFLEPDEDEASSSPEG